ncbi:MAG: RHS repeat-associated core domain-containing protein [Kiritimatiellae bacterium]|nr:RHS repeat-associated core domain-containing protein [Kiritimatiellia bacterium]
MLWLLLASTTLVSIDYPLNDVGHCTRITEASGRVRNFNYDNLNRLTRKAVTGDASGVNGTVDYSYDLVGNRLDRISSLPEVDTDVQLHDLNDRLQSDYVDDNGNTLVSTGFTTGDVYDPWDRLVRRVKSNGEIVDLMYDTAGNRVAKSVQTGSATTYTAYLVDSHSLTGYAQVLEELCPDGMGGLKVFRTYAVGHTQLTQTQLLPDGNGGEQWETHAYLLDGQNSVWGLADTLGSVTDSYAYDAYGILLSETGAGTPNLYRYTGEQWDPDLEHYYLRARYYEPDRGRFWTMDTYEGRHMDPATLHKYLYAHANPVMNTDPSGNYSLSEVQIASGISAGLNLAVNLTFNRGQKTLGRMLLEATFSGVAGGLIAPAAPYISAFAGQGLWQGLVASITLGGYSSGVSAVKMRIFEGEVDGAKLTANFIAGSLVSAATFGFSSAVSDEIDPTIITRFILPYIGGVSKAFASMVIDASRDLVDVINNSGMRKGLLFESGHIDFENNAEKHQGK